MKNVSRIFILIILIGSVGTIVYGDVVDRVVAIVNRKVITLYQLQQAEKTFPQEDSSPGSFEYTRQEKVLNALIENELIRQKAEEKGILVSEEELKTAIAEIRQRNQLVSDEQLKQALSQQGTTWEEFVKDIQEQIKVSKLVNREVLSKIEIAEDEIKTYYQTHPELFQQAPSTVRIRHIVLNIPENASESEVQSIKEQAESIVQQLRSGADFAQMVHTYSDDPDSSQSEGELGTFKQGELAAPYDIAFNMEVGEISAPVRSASGFHIINVQEKLSGDQATYEKAISRIRNRLFEEKWQNAYEVWVKELKEAAYIEIVKE